MKVTINRIKSRPLKTYRTQKTIGNMERFIHKFDCYKLLFNYEILSKLISFDIKP